MKERYKKLIKEIMPRMQCSKKFKCIESGFENLCKTRNYWNDNTLECLESNPDSCEFAVPSPDGCLCRCPLRIYLKEKLGK